MTPPHVELLVQQVLPRRGLHGVLILQNRSTVVLEVVKRDGPPIGFPPSAVADMAPGDRVRTPPFEPLDRAAPVSEDEVYRAKRLGQRQFREGADYLWITRLSDGRALFLMPWHIAGVQLSVGSFTDAVFTDTWDFDRELADAGWRAVLGWDGTGEPAGWTRHPLTGRVRPDGTAASETIEGRR